MTTEKSKKTALLLGTMEAISLLGIDKNLFYQWKADGTLKNGGVVARKLPGSRRVKYLYEEIVNFTRRLKTA